MKLRILGLIVCLVILMLSVISCNNPSSTEEVSISVKSVNFADTTYSGKTQQVCTVVFLVTDNSGNPLSDQRVDFKIVGGDGALSSKSEYTDFNGTISIKVVKNSLIHPSKLKATVFGYEVSVTQTL